MSEDKTKPVLLVKKADSKKGSLWNTLTNQRIIKQHGGFDIPEDDLHAIHKYSSPLVIPHESEEETKETLSELEQEIKQLKDNEDPNRQSQRESLAEPKEYNEEE
jgi:hypothetical protein